MRAIEHKELGVAVFHSECIANNFDTQAAATHTEHYDRSKALFSDLFSKLHNLLSMLEGRIGYIEPPKPILDRFFGLTICLPDCRIFSPDTGY